MKKFFLLSLLTFSFAACSVDGEEDLNHLNAVIECEANAGSDNSGIVTTTYLDEEVDDIGQVRRLFTDLLDEDVPKDGTFNPTMSQLLIEYRSRSTGDFSTTYTVGEGDCQDSAELTLTITDCDTSAGNDKSGVVTATYVDEEIDDIGQVRRLFTDLLDEGVPTDGVCDPSIAELYAQYKKNPIGDFITTYTVGEGDCLDSCELVLSVVPCDISGLVDNSATYVHSVIDEQIDDIGQIRTLYTNLLGENVPTNGNFNPTIAELYAEYRRNNIGAFTTTYSIEDGECIGTAELTVNITED